MIAAGLVMADWNKSLGSYRVGVTGRSEFVNGLSFVVPLSCRFQLSAIGSQARRTAESRELTTGGYSTRVKTSRYPDSTNAPIF